VKAKKFFTGDNDKGDADDGLKQEWNGRVFLNPPYHRELQPKFIDKLLAEIDAGHTKQAIVLVNNSTDTEWFRKAAAKSDAMCFTVGRINFITPTSGDVLPTQGQVFFYYGKAVAKFIEVFRHHEIGWIAKYVAQEKK